jgi:ribosomal protein S18 acetylase RimI-like enzyme
MKANSHRIVPLAERHIRGFHRALDCVAREKKYLLFLEAPPLAAVRKFVRAGMRHRDPKFVALSGSDVVGWCDIFRGDRETTRHCGRLGIALLPEFRDQGIGARLMKRAIATAWKRKFTRIELSVREDNRRAIALYKSLGFEVEGLLRKAIMIDGRYYNLLTMALLQ